MNRPKELLSAAEALLSMSQSSKLICGEGKRGCDGVPSVVRVEVSSGAQRRTEEDMIFEQWLKCFNDMSTAKQIRFMGEYILHKCVNMWHNKSFDLETFFVYGITDYVIIWNRLLFDLRSFVKKVGTRYGSSMLRRSKKLGNVHSQPICKHASQWAIRAVNELIMSGIDLPYRAPSFVSFAKKNNKMRYIDDNMKTIQRILHVYIRQIMLCKEENKNAFVHHNISFPADYAFD